MAKVEKQQFRNNTDGWIGAVEINAKGEERHFSVEAGHSVWLSEDEQVILANAPRDPKDNPFMPQTHIVQDSETGARTETQVVPLELVNDARYVPANARPIPSQLIEDGTLAVPPPAPQPPVTPETPGQAEDAAQEPAEAPQEPHSPPMPAVPLPPGASNLPTPPDEGRMTDEQRAAEQPVAEEVAEQSPGPQSEETGAAVEPVGEAVAGTYSPGEEVGTPGAPAQQGSPAPWTAEG